MILPPPTVVLNHASRRVGGRVGDLRGWRRRRRRDAVEAHRGVGVALDRAGPARGRRRRGRSRRAGRRGVGRGRPRALAQPVEQRGAVGGDRRRVGRRRSAERGGREAVGRHRAGRGQRRGGRRAGLRAGERQRGGAADGAAVAQAAAAVRRPTARASARAATTSSGRPSRTSRPSGDCASDSQRPRCATRVLMTPATLDAGVKSGSGAALASPWVCTESPPGRWLQRARCGGSSGAAASPARGRR